MTHRISYFGWSILLVFCCISAVPAQQRYTEPFRPQFHFTPERNWMNDPNGLVFYEGEWHLFYQHNPYGDRWGHMSWGHAVSRDLVHWEHLPLALAEEDGIMIFSGSAVVDWKDTSGFGEDGKPPLVAIYTGDREGRQDQRLAYSNDRGRTWTKFAGNPVLDMKMADFRDPKVFFHEGTSRWIMTVALATEKKVRFYASPNLKNWTNVGEFGHAGSVDGLWECPDLFPLPVAGGGEKWVQIVNVNPGGPAGGSGTQYFVGEFDGAEFVRDPQSPTPAELVPQPLWADYGADFYAGVSWSDVPKADGRRVWIGWMSNWNYANDVPTSPWRNAMSIPRELSLVKTPEGLRLKQSPAAELKALRREELSLADGTIAEANAWLKEHKLSSGPLEISFTAKKTDGLTGLRLYAGKEQGTLVAIDRNNGRVLVDRSKSGLTSFNPNFGKVQSAPLPTQGAKVTLHLFVDTSSVEVFVNGGEQVLSSLIFPAPESSGIEFAGGEHSQLSSIHVWRLKSAYWPAANR